MGVRRLSSVEVGSRMGQVDVRSGVLFAEQGLQPYYDWLMGTVDRLIAGGVFDYLVSGSDQSATSVYVSPGRATVGSVVLVYAGGDFELGALNNATVYVWLEEDAQAAGAAKIGYGVSGSGWPGGTHLKLAEVVLAKGEVVGLVDLRGERMLVV